MASWKIICSWLRTWRISSVPSVERSTPSSSTRPDVGGGTRMIALPVVDLPQPDSPTMPSVSRSARSRLTSLTAWTVPRRARELDDEVLDLEHQVVAVVAEVGGAGAGHQMPPSRTSKRART